VFDAFLRRRRYGDTLAVRLTARAVLAPDVHPGLLLATAIALSAFSVVGGLLLLRHAPAVSIALFSAVIVGTFGSFLSAADGPKGVPAETVGWATLGLVAGGVIGLATTRGKPPSSLLRHAAVGCLIALPFGAVLIVLLVQQACPLYVTQGAGYCFYDFDMLGAWASEVTFFLSLDVLIVVALLLVSGRQAKRHEGVNTGDDGWSQILI